MCKADFVGMTAEAAVILVFFPFAVHVTGNDLRLLTLYCSWQTYHVV